MLQSGLLCWQTFKEAAATPVSLTWLSRWDPGGRRWIWEGDERTILAGRQVLETLHHDICEETRREEENDKRKLLHKGVGKNLHLKGALSHFLPSSSFLWSQNLKPPKDIRLKQLNQSQPIRELLRFTSNPNQLTTCSWGQEVIWYTWETQVSIGLCFGRPI